MKALAVVLAIWGVCWFTADGQPRPPVPGPVYAAVRSTPWHRAQRIQAFDVIYCESRYSVFATNGQYLGLFQFGSWARSRFGFGWSARAQAWAAWRYWSVSGWSGWECQP